MQLFDEFQSRNLKLSGYSEPYFCYWNKTGRPAFAYLREVVQRWFDGYDASEDKRKSLRQNFRSEDDTIHLSAFFELYLYELFSKLDYEIQVEPEMPNGTKPDFLLIDRTGKQILLEATGVYPDSEFGKMKQLENKILDEINDRVSSPDFFLDVRVREAPFDNPPYAKIARHLDYHIRNLNVENIRRKLLQTPPDFSDDLLKIPTYPGHDWDIEFRLIPKNQARGKSGIRPIGMTMFDASFLDQKTPIRSSLDSKSSRYGDLNIAYILALNICAMPLHQNDLVDALFGDEVWYVNFDSNESNFGRKSNGSWRNKHGWQKTRMSGVLTFDNLRPSKIGSKTPTLWHHPEAQCPVDADKFLFSQRFVNSEGHLEFIQGIHPYDIMGFNADKLKQLMDAEMKNR